MTSHVSHVRLCLRGNGASHRLVWTAKMFLDEFESIERGARCPWTARIQDDGFIMFHHSVDPLSVVKRFIRFSTKKVIQGLGSYTRCSLDVRRGVHNGSMLVVLIRTLYPTLKPYKIIVLAPDSAKTRVVNFRFLLEQMESFLHWDVNSITQYSDTGDGVRFEAIEWDACDMFNYLADKIQDQLPGIMHDVTDTPLLDVRMMKCRRGNSFYIRLGIVWATADEPVDWGAAFPAIPLSSLAPIGIDNPNDICAICLNPLEQSLVQWGPCKHVFHLECVKTMCGTSSCSECPLCRSEMSEFQRVFVSPPTRPKKRRAVTRSMTQKNRRKLSLD